MGYRGIVVRPGLHALDGTFLECRGPVYRYFERTEEFFRPSLDPGKVSPHDIAAQEHRLEWVKLLDNGFGAWVKPGTEVKEILSLLCRGYANSSPAGLRDAPRTTDAIMGRLR